MILSFKDKETKKVFDVEYSKKFPSEIQLRAQKKLRWLDVANSLNDLIRPPSNRLEKLSGGREGQYSIRINDQYRICFEWNGNNAENVELTDYH
ncbi:MAG: type II toxin-antitoxin system RelE/ParE family toxin [Chitinispirillia bacterium]|nr:type II toxin-antitoxin system RelE/ParE family toxin [Chitinispirillia bacterium]